jgi:hypothetical protein
MNLYVSGPLLRHLLLRCCGRGWIRQYSVSVNILNNADVASMNSCCYMST